MVMYAVADRTVKLNGFQSIYPFFRINSSTAGDFSPALLKDIKLKKRDTVEPPY